jgi:hypothetical protein
MSLLREYVRELLVESAEIHPKIMELIDRAEKLGYKLKLRDDRLIMFDPETVEMKGKIQFSKARFSPSDGPCGGAAMVASSSAQDGLGPLMYDVVIERSGGLIADRYSVSKEALAVWDRYMNGRPDIEAVQLDDLRNTLTDEDEDNCNQDVSALDVGTKIKHGWVDSSLSKMYRKKGGGTPAMDELRKRGMLK